MIDHFQTCLADYLDISKCLLIWVEYLVCLSLSLFDCFILFAQNLNHMADFTQSFISWKKLTFKGQEGQERSCNFLFQNFWELRLMQNRFLSKKNHFWFIQNLNLVEFEGVYCTVAYPCWPLKAKKFSSKHFFLRKWSMVKIWLISIHWFLRYRGGSKSQTRQGALAQCPKILPFETL